jgi:putative CocE/NonD family hydrolase
MRCSRSLAVWWCSFAWPLAAQAPPDPTQGFTKTDTMITMRDGVRLHTTVYVPQDAHTALPFILLRTPYGIDDAPRRVFAGYLKALVEEGYIFAFQDIRGRFRSEGKFVMQRPPRGTADPRAIDESTDAYDTIDWLVTNVPGNSGRVGMLGISYDGWLTAMAMLDPHPALKAVSPQASPADMFLGDDFHHNGAFRLSYGFEYAVLTEATDTNAQFGFDRYDTFAWYLALGALANANERYLHGTLPSWNDFILHPNYDAFWQRQAFAPYLTRVTVPTLNVGGWWDQEDFYGPLKIYELLERHDSLGRNFLVVGPWNHGGWGRGPGRKLGVIDFGSNTAEYFRDSIQAPWFAYFLKDKGPLRQPEALTFEAGANRWVASDAWPPHAGITERRLYLREGGRLSFDPPAEATTAAGATAAFDQYVSDPAHPVPYRHRPIEPTYFPRGSGWYTWLLEDQRFVHLRPDVLSWESAPLSADLVVKGDIMAHLFAATTGSDADWIVKLIDVYPEDYAPDPKLGGYQLMVANDVFRGRFRRSFERPEAIVPGRVAEYTIDLHSQDYRFLKGHRLMVQVQSTWFPLIDRNPQTYVENIFQAKDSDYRAATQRIYRSRRFPSSVVLPVGPP